LIKVHTPLARSTRPSTAVMNVLSAAACSATAVFAATACSTRSCPRRRVLRRLPTPSVAVSALATPCPIASVTLKCSTSRARL
jgi:hypothetical protein